MSFGLSVSFSGVRKSGKTEEHMKAIEKAKLAKIVNAEGFPTIDDMLEAAAADSVCPGVCMACDFVVSEVEPDQDQRWCENWGGNTVQSALVVAGLI